MAEILKVDEDQRMAFGWAYVAVDAAGQQVVDLSGDVVDDPEELAKAAYDFVLNARTGDVMHQEKVIGELVESLVITPDKLAKLGVPDGVLPQSAWWIGFHVTDPGVWSQIRAGDWTAFSVGGEGVRTPMGADT